MFPDLDTDIILIVVQEKLTLEEMIEYLIEISNIFINENETNKIQKNDVKILGMSKETKLNVVKNYIKYKLNKPKFNSEPGIEMKRMV